MSLQILARKLASAPARSRLAPQGAAVYKPPTGPTENAPFVGKPRRFVNRRSVIIGLLAVCLCATVDGFGAGTRRLDV
ncbi:MAG TPA: hypothetical protein VGW39_03080, partial [Chthoniobacterales bacterium]|nr:hypothetical protein [Chthoniobacterales bacterium]